MIAKFWERLEGAVHPDDSPIFVTHPEHSFNLRFPPPAFIGAVDKAPIVILMSNGGYKFGVTEAEFPDETSVLEFRGFIRGEVGALPPRLAEYYVSGPFASWIADGSAVLVNTVPYRSPRLSEEPYNQRVAKQLASLEAHRRWLTREVLPEAKRERRFVLVHRNRWWQIPKEFAGSCVLFSDPVRAEPNRLAPDQEKLDRAREWLRRQGKLKFAKSLQLFTRKFVKSLARSTNAPTRRSEAGRARAAPIAAAGGRAGVGAPGYSSARASTPRSNHGSYPVCSCAA